MSRDICGAADEQDAVQLIEDLRTSGLIKDATVRKLGWFARWRIREQYAGNYVSGQPFNITQL